MFNILFFSDLHVYTHKHSSLRLQDCLACLGWVIQTAKDNDIKDIVFLGDLFHDRQRIHVLAYHHVYQMLKTASDISFTLLVGNHDMWFFDKTDVSSIMPLNSLPNVTVIKNPTTKVIQGLAIDFAPYSHDPTSVLGSFNNKSPLLCGHLAVDGALLNFVHKTYSEVEIESDADMIPLTPSFFKGWEKVLLGHYHGAQMMDNNIEYVGSPLELTWNETTQEKHVILMDTETMEQKYVINNFSPKHICLKPEELDNYDLNNVFLKVKIDGLEVDDLLQLKSELTAKYDLRDLDFSQDKPVETLFNEDNQEKFDVTKGDVLERFVRTIGVGELEESLVLEIGRNICTTEI